MFKGAVTALVTPFKNGTIDEDAYRAARAFATTEGLLVGITSGAALHAATELAKQMPKDARIAVLLPDTGERYLSTKLFQK